MEKAISVVGGDLRIIKVVEILIRDGYKVYTFGMELSEELMDIQELEMCPTLDEAVKNARIVLGPIPLTSDRKNLSMPFSNIKLPIEEFAKKIANKTLIAGNYPEAMKKDLKDNNINFIDIAKREEFVVLNAIATAEGTIQIAMEETQRTIHGNKILVMGFGRIGKVLAKMLSGLGAEVYCEARRDDDLAWIKVYGYKPIHLMNLDNYLDQFDIIINTIPFQVLDDEKLALVRKDVVIIDLASNPGGVDIKAAKNRGLKLIWALSISGKVAPLTSAEYIVETLYHVLKEL